MKHFQRLTTDDEFATFAEQFAAAVATRSKGRMHSEVPLDYLRRSQVMAVMDRGRMVAGFVINPNPPFRLVEGFVPDDAEVVLPPGTTWGDCCEFTCAWRTAEVSRLYMNAAFWPRVILEGVRTGRLWGLGHSEHERLDAMYTQTGPFVLYEGPSKNGLPSRLFAYHRTKGPAHILRSLFLYLPSRLLRR